MEDVEEISETPTLPLLQVITPEMLVISLALPSFSLTCLFIQYTHYEDLSWARYYSRCWVTTIIQTWPFLMVNAH